MAQIFPIDPTPITLADGKERHLRYSMGAVKRIKAQFGQSWEAMIKTPLEDLLPKVLMEGLIEKEGLTESVLCDELLTGPMTDYAAMCFVEAFFGHRLRRNMEELDNLRQAELEKRMRLVADSILAAEPTQTTQVQ